PAVVVVAATVVQLQLAAVHGFDREMIELCLGGDLEPLAARERFKLISTFVIEAAGTCRLAREHALSRSQLEGAPEEQAREKLEIEAYCTNPPSRQRLGQVHDHTHCLAVGDGAHCV